MGGAGLNTVSGTHTDKYRLLSDKSTSNISIETVNANLEDLEKRRLELEERLRLLTGEEEMGNQEQIPSDNGE